MKKFIYKVLISIVVFPLIFNLGTVNVKASNASWKDNLYQQGYKAFFKKQYITAIKIEDKLIKADVNYYKAYNLKGIAQCYNGDFNGGIANINKAIKMNPKFGYALFNKALAYELYGYYSKAIKYYNDALKIEKYVWSYYGIASIYGRKGDVKNTVRYLKTAIELDSSVKRIAPYEKDFTNVRYSSEFKALFK